MNRFTVVGVAVAGIAALAPSTVAHAATTYKTLTRPAFTTQYPSSFVTQDFAGKDVFHSADGALFPTLTGVGAADASAVIYIGSHSKQDSASQVVSIETTALSTVRKGYKRVAAITKATKKIGAHSYLIYSDVLADAKSSTLRQVYATTLSGHSFYFFVTATSKATTADEQGLGYIIGATRAR